MMMGFHPSKRWYHADADTWFIQTIWQETDNYHTLFPQIWYAYSPLSTHFNVEWTSKMSNLQIKGIFQAFLLLVILFSWEYTGVLGLNFFAKIGRDRKNWLGRANNEKKVKRLPEWNCSFGLVWFTAVKILLFEIVMQILRYF